MPQIVSGCFGRGLQSFSHSGLRPLRLFEDVLIVPAQGIRQSVYRGGPIWPDWDRQLDVRQCRHGRPVDEMPRAMPVARELDRPAVWGGQFYPHFGHQIADYAARILQAARERPGDPVLFLLHPTRRRPPPSYSFDIMSWLGVTRDRIEFITEPVRARQLYVAAQAEQLPDIGPSSAYLDLLDETWERHGLKPIAADVVYVTRVGMGADACGNHAGEAYLVNCLRRLGVTVIRPEKLSLQAQMQAYAGARALVFAEGSALHGRQLLGRVDQTIIVLNRRRRIRLARAALEPRCSWLCYAEAAADEIVSVQRNGSPLATRALSIYDCDVLFAAFAALGIDLQRVWDERTYRRIREREIRHWLSVQLRSPLIDLPSSVPVIRGKLAEHRFQHLLEDVLAGDQALRRRSGRQAADGARRPRRARPAAIRQATDRGRPVNA
jgi:hypothetical protein